MVASVKLLHLLEAFSTPWFLFSSPSNHHLVFFLLEIFNNIIQYQFDGNSNLVYTIIRKRQIFHALANLPTDNYGISKCLNSRRGGGKFHRISPAVVKKEEQKYVAPAKEELDEVSEDDTNEDDEEDTETDDKSETRITPEPSMEGSTPAQPAEPGTLKVTLLDIPAITQMTEPESAHPPSQPLCDLGSPSTEIAGTNPIVGVQEQPEIEIEIPKVQTVSISIVYNDDFRGNLKDLTYKIC